MFQKAGVGKYMIIELTLRGIVGDVAPALPCDQQLSPGPFHLLEQQDLSSELTSPAGCNQPGSAGAYNYYIIIIHGNAGRRFCASKIQHPHFISILFMSVA
jgi:hypothetical protein